MKGLIIKKNANVFTVESNNDQYFCSARKNLKEIGVFVGDRVEFCENELVINSVESRKNLLIRPPIANLDKMLIVIANKPAPDLYLVDKLILFCFVNGISPVLCVNKIDGEKEQFFFEKISKIYRKVLPVLCLSALKNKTEGLESCVEGISAFAGQSAVGKSSLINSIFNDQLEKTDGFAKKVERGKQTTRLVTLYKTQNGYLADTAGFSRLDESLIDVQPNEIARYYPDFLPFLSNCKYRSCLHKNPKDCGLCNALQSGKISVERYENYLKLLEYFE